MHRWTEVMQDYVYDGSFEGFLSCVFIAFMLRELPADIRPECKNHPSLFPVRQISTNTEHAQRILVSIPKKMGQETFDFFSRAFLTCLPQKEKIMLLFLQLGYQHGYRVCRLLTDPVVHRLTKAVQHLNNETHLLTGFVRFSDYQGILVSQIDPKNRVLPLLQSHFCDRYPQERFIIYDQTHSELLAHENGHSYTGFVDNFTLPSPDQQEKHYRSLWKLFYDTIAIETRLNPKCRQSHMPNRYWKNLTELQSLENEGQVSATVFKVPTLSSFLP